MGRPRNEVMSVLLPEGKHAIKRQRTIHLEWSSFFYLMVRTLFLSGCTLYYNCRWLWVSSKLCCSSSVLTSLYFVHSCIKNTDPDSCPSEVKPRPMKTIYTGKWHMYNVHSIAMMIECIYHKIFTLAFLSTAQGMKESAVKRALYSWTSRQNSRQCRKVWWQPEMESHLNVPVRNMEHPQSI